MKSKLCLCLCLLPLLAPVPLSAAEVWTNLTPEIAVPSSWSYESSPGAFFWNGFGVGLLIVSGCWMMSMVRTAFGGNSHEEL